MNLDIYRYDSAPAFLNAALKKAGRQKVTVRGFSRRAGIKSPATLSLILRGRRGISMDMGERIAAALKLQGRRKTYFMSLCRISATRSEDDSLNLKAECLRQKTLAETQPLNAAQYRFLSRWYYVVIYVLSGGTDFEPNPELLARRIGNGITAHEIAKGLEDLQVLGMLKVVDGKLVQGMGRYVKTSEDSESLAIQMFHRQMSQIAIRSLARPVEDRDISGLTVLVAEEQIPQVKERIRKFREKLDTFIEGGPRSGRVYQLNINFFPLTGKV